MNIKNIYITSDVIPAPVYVGRVGEYGITTVRADLSGYIKEYGDGHAELFYVRPNETKKYLATTQMVGNYLEWPIDNFVTEIIGEGKCEVWFYPDNGLKKSFIFSYYVNTGFIIDEDTTPPDPVLSWAENATQTLADIKASVPIEVADYYTEHKDELKGDPFTFDDFTSDQLEQIRGFKGDPFKYEDFTQEQLDKLIGPKGEAGDQGEKGEKGDPFKYEDFTEEQLAALTGPQGDPGIKGDPGEVVYIENPYNDTEIKRNITSLNQELSSKVSKVTGKDLSTNDYSDADKIKVDAIPADPKYTDTLYDDTNIKKDIVQLDTTINTRISAHNSSSTAHEDIRELISGLTTRLNSLADSDDETLDQLSEIVAYIKSNKELIDGVTTGKVNVSDIVDNLTSNDVAKPLSANQGKILKKLLEEIASTKENIIKWQKGSVVMAETTFHLEYNEELQCYALIDAFKNTGYTDGFYIMTFNGADYLVPRTALCDGIQEDGHTGYYYSTSFGGSNITDKILNPADPGEDTWGEDRSYYAWENTEIPFVICSSWKTSGMFSLFSSVGGDVTLGVYKVVFEENFSGLQFDNVKRSIAAYGSKASAKYGAAFGEYNVASDEGDFVGGGKFNIASGGDSFATGWGNVASGYASHAEGWRSIASGDASHAEGDTTEASGEAAHAEGCLTVASGNRSHAEGNSTVASGANSHAEGWGTIAEGYQSHAEGYGTEAAKRVQHTYGKYNIADTYTQDLLAGNVDENGVLNTSSNFGKYIEIAGNGNINERSNAYTLDWEGNAWFSGNVYVGSTSGTNKDEGSVKLAKQTDLDNKANKEDLEYVIYHEDGDDPDENDDEYLIVTDADMQQFTNSVNNYTKEVNNLQEETASLKEDLRQKIDNTESRLSESIHEIFGQANAWVNTGEYTVDSHSNLESGYVNSSGEIVKNDIHKHVKVSTENATSIKFTVIEKPNASIVVLHKKDADTYSGYVINVGENSIPLVGFDFIYINFFANGNFPNIFTISYEENAFMPSVRSIENKADFIDKKYTSVILNKESVIPFSILPKERGFMKADGTNGGGTNFHQHVSLPADMINTVTIESKTSFASLPVIIVKDKDGNVVLAKGGNNLTRIVTDVSAFSSGGYTIYLNWYDSLNEAYDYANEASVNYVSFQKTTEDAIKHKLEIGYEVYSLPWNTFLGKDTTLVFDEIPLLNGYISNTNADGIGGMHKHIMIPSQYIKSITMQNKGTAPGVPYAYYYSSIAPISGVKNLISVGGGTYRFSQPMNGFIGVNVFLQGDFADRVEFEFWNEEEMTSFYTRNKETIYHSIVRKPMNFSGKKATFTGDSITYGFTTGTTNVHDTGDYPTLFSNAVGLIKTNRGSGGATLSDGSNTIMTQIRNADKNCDFLFIAGGINDWQTGIELSDFKVAVKNICDYINENYSNETKVIWITPINQGGWETNHTINPKGTVQDFRNIITRVAMENDIYTRFSVVQGNEFNFPNLGDDSEYIGAMFGDKLHPSALGYKTLYLTGLLNTLC